MLLDPRSTSRYSVDRSTHIVTSWAGPNLTDVKFHEPGSTRVCSIERVFAPITSRMVPGFRAQIVDQKGFRGFVEQRDLEVLLGVAQPGDVCPWLSNMKYVDPEDPDWFGIGCDDDEIEELLFLNEVQYRQQTPNGLLTGLNQKWNDMSIPPDITLHIIQTTGRCVELLYTFTEDSVTFDGREYVANISVHTVTDRWKLIQCNTIDWVRFHVP